MKRHLKFIAMVLLIPPAFAFAVVFIKALLGLEFSAEFEWSRSHAYAAGVVVGAWIYGASA